jgi:two-component system sensor histidine kinase UhpB
MRAPPASLLPAAGAVAAETLLIDPASLRLLDANASACHNLQFSHAELVALHADALLPGLARSKLVALLGGLAKTIDPFSLDTRLQRRDGSSYPVRLRLLRLAEGAVLAVGEDLSAQHAVAGARDQYRDRFDLIVSHTPGLVFQQVLHSDGKVAFPYLSDGCQALLGKRAGALQKKPDLLLLLILPEDRRGYLDAMHASAQALAPWNWEGRIWIDAWKDVKWINLRATPRALPQPAGSVQWEGIMSNITDSRQERIDVRQSRDRLAELTAHFEQVKEQERTRVAREIHDELGGNLTAIKMALALLSKHLPEGNAMLADKAAYLDTLVDRSIDAVHRISLDLRPAMLDLGIHAAIEWQLREFASHSALACRFEANDPELELGGDQATALFRIFQEALTNIAKHARATRVVVSLQRLRHQVSLKIRDNGVGIGLQDRSKPDSFGLRGMSERAEALGGALTVGDARGGGTVVAIKIPLAAPTTTIITMSK